jgi:glucosamine kinase
MILIADSGSTKTDWILFTPEGKNIAECSTIGMNPFFAKENDILLALQNSSLNTHKSEVKEIHFYGAGCSTPEKCTWLESILNQFFNHAKVSVKTDIEGAVLALSGGEPCIACILGTGSTFRIFDGNEILSRYSSLGFIVGDEGSGTHISKSLLRHVFYKRFSAQLEQEFFNYFGLTRSEIIQNIYEKPFPNRFLASFVPFCKEFIHEPAIEVLVLNSLEEFIDTHILRLPQSKNYPVHFVGSIAFHFEHQLRKIGAKYSLNIGKIEQKPLQLLKDNFLKNKVS